MMQENEVQINAPPSVVWSVTEDIERWPEWTPTVHDVKRLNDGHFDVGAAARVKQPGLPEAVWRVTALTRGVGFTWETRIRGIRMVATHELAASAEGTRNILRLKVSGIVAAFFWPLIRGSIRRALEQENRGLKAACEAKAKTG